MVFLALAGDIMLASEPHPFLAQIEKSLEKTGADLGLHDVLNQVLAHFECSIGTIHSLDPESNLLRLRAQRGISEELMPRIQEIPMGKGMAGLAAQRRQPVQVCNLQADASGVAKPGAKMTQMEGSIAVPILVGDSLRGVLGVAKPIVYEFTEAEVSFLLQIGRVIGQYLSADFVPGKDGGRDAQAHP
jgi:signal transduction protein with GAF and PtsI domain